jgi:putative ABC transport system permease protein
MMSSGERALRILAMVIIFVSALSIFISLFSSLRERRYELALMRSMGATPNRLFGLIITEGLILAVLGYIIGIIGSHVAMWFVANMMSTDYHYNFDPFQFVKQEGFLFVGALLIGLIAALIPALQARKTDIADTLLGQH